MAFNGSGVFQRLYNWTNDAAANIKIRADRMDNEMNGMATGLSTCITKDGQTTVTANLPMAGFRHTGVGSGTSRTDYTRLDQAQDGKLAWVDGGGTSDAITASYGIPITALVDGQLCFVRATAANATTTPTFSPNSLTARTIVKTGGDALVVGDIAGDGHELILRYDLTNTRWELLNPATTVVKNNFAASAAPASGDDSGDGYSAGSMWVNTSTDTFYVCVDSTLGAAVWRGSDEIIAAGSAGVVVKNSAGATVATLGSAATANVSFAGAVNITGDLGMTGKVNTAATASGGAGLNIPHGTAPSSPTNGDLWSTTSGSFSRINGVTRRCDTFGLEFTSTDQTITSGGALTLAHSLGVAPKIVICQLVCQTGEAGYTAGDVLDFPNGPVGTANKGLSVVGDSTNINIRFGGAASSFDVLDKSSGAAAALTNANWKLRVKAWA